MEETAEKMGCGVRDELLIGAVANIPGLTFGTRWSGCKSGLSSQRINGPSHRIGDEEEHYRHGNSLT